MRRGERVFRVRKQELEGPESHRSSTLDRQRLRKNREPAKFRETTTTTMGLLMGADG